jgi:hypothetical protein
MWGCGSVLRIVRELKITVNLVDEFDGYVTATILYPKG